MLTECDLPTPDEPLGVTHKTPAERGAYINFRRAQNGLKPLERPVEPGKPEIH